MSNNLRPTLVNPISLLGAVMAVFSLVIIVVLLFLGATGAIANPYTGILAFMIGPAALVFGLILIPIGVIRERRHQARYGLVAATFPVLNLNDPGQRRGVMLFSGATAGILLLMTVTTWGAADFMESSEFCGQVCHRVMQPEDAGHTASPHARVECVACHIGPGAPWLVKSKISGIRQVVAVAFNSYPRPIPAPIEDLRPSRDTCEQCHWPQRFYGDQLISFVHYAQDQQNTMTSQPMVFRVGGSELGTGIHWHTTAKISYLPLDDKRSVIGWVRVEKPDGTVDEYVLPDQKDKITPQLIQSDQRFMDCIDCHNRAAHNFGDLDGAIDGAMSSGTISADIPSIKQQAMQAFGTVGASITDAEYQQALTRIDAIEGYYRTQQPDVYGKLGPQIKQAIAGIKSVYQSTVFPNMDVTPDTYTNWATHDGCFRCHGKLVGTKGEATAKTISSSCLMCHYPSQVSAPPAGALTTGSAPSQPQSGPIMPAVVPHTLQGRDRCTACHTVGGPGAGVPGGTGLPADHQGRTDDTCLGCHAVSQAPSAPAAPAAAPTTTAAPAATSPAPTAAAPAAPTTAPAPAAPTSALAPAAQPAAQPTAAAAQPTAAVPPPAAVAGPPAIPHATAGREQCTTCHTVGGPGVGAPGGTGLPTDHQGRTAATCTGCHKAG
jgi:hypothetical protein